MMPTQITELAILHDAHEIASVDIRSENDHYVVMIFMGDMNKTLTFEFPNKVASIIFGEAVWRLRWAACADLRLS